MHNIFFRLFSLWLTCIYSLSVQAFPVQNLHSLPIRPRRALQIDSIAGDESAVLAHQLDFLEIKPPSHMETFAHESVTLTCQAGGNPPPTIHWLKNGIPIIQSSFENSELLLEQLSGRGGGASGLDETEANSNTPVIGISSTRSRLFLDCLQPKDSAIYTCVAETPYSRISTDTKLIVADGPNKLGGSECIEKRSSSTGYGKPARITMWTDTRMELTGADVKLFCRVSGTPTPQVAWERAEDGEVTPEVIHNDARHKILPNGDLIIKNVSWEEDMGRFICVAQNSLGIDKAKMFLYPTPGL
ncbi:zwei Ig domain protein zig-4-like [Paramacrobiotus metropolitanus]|uniref:zwei Ig domain protein zig-4-like n=1 Tax=Paramacrobiotus metropolitanus TaxID=2943436 RepID=UPI0024463ACB|nr:zwei Ig domain protein zig-4-like [Paramacrobiotus metropolitanus]